MLEALQTLAGDDLAAALFVSVVMACGVLSLIRWVLHMFGLGG